MKSRDEIVIIMLQWLRLYTLGSRGSRELKTFLETRLISSRVDQKLKNKEGIHEFLKREIGPESWAVEADVDAGLQRRGSGFLAWRCNSRMCGEFSSKLASMNATFAPRSGHDHAVIGPRSWVDPRSLASKATFQSSGR